MTRPEYQAPEYRGGGSGNGRDVAIFHAREGADVAEVYLNGHNDARKTNQLVRAEGRRCLLIPGMFDEKKVDEFGTAVPLGRPGQPEEVAPAFVYLVSEADSSYVNGQILHVNG